MARQRGIFPYEGTVGDVTGYKRGGTYYFRLKSSLSAERVKTDPKFAASQKASAAFGQDARKAGRIRRALSGYEEGLVHGEIIADLTKAIQKCPLINPTGTGLPQRDLARFATPDSPFSFKRALSTKVCFQGGYTLQLNATTLTLAAGPLDFPGHLLSLSGATHAKATLILTHIPGTGTKDAGTYPPIARSETAWLPVGDRNPIRFEVPLTNLIARLPKRRAHAGHLMVALLVEGGQVIADIAYPLNTLKALDIPKIFDLQDLPVH